ncbi:MAG: hypothetical protein CSA72_10645, partial [Rhodobacterales bacterium]
MPQRSDTLKLTGLSGQTVDFGPLVVRGAGLHGPGLSWSFESSMQPFFPSVRPLSPAAWYDPSDLSTLFQDAAMTIPVTADGDPVGAVQDRSGN